MSASLLSAVGGSSSHTNTARPAQVKRRKNSTSRRCCSTSSQRCRRIRGIHRSWCSHHCHTGTRRRAGHLLVGVSRLWHGLGRCCRLTIREGPVSARLHIVLSLEKESGSLRRRWDFHVVGARDLDEGFGWERHGDGFNDCERLAYRASTTSARRTFTGEERKGGKHVQMQDSESSMSARLQ